VFAFLGTYHQHGEQKHSFESWLKTDTSIELYWHDGLLHSKPSGTPPSVHVPAIEDFVDVWRSSWEPMRRRWRPRSSTATLPGLWRTLGGVLPPGESVDLARSALLFDGARIAGPIVVLARWAVLGLLLALALGGRIMDPVDAEAAAAAGAAV
jgi:hypothetical protein